MRHNDYRQDELQDVATAYIGEDFHERSRADFVAGADWADKHPKRGMVNIEDVCQYLAENMLCNGYTLQTKAKFISNLRKYFS